MQKFFRISPGFCFADGLASLALLRQGMKDKTSDGVYDWNVTGASMCYLAVQVCVSLALICITTNYNFMDAAFGEYI